MPEICIVKKRDYSVVMKQFPFLASSRLVSGVCVCVCVCVYVCMCVPLAGQRSPILCYLTVAQVHVLPNLHRELIKHTKSGFLCLCKLEYGHHCDTKIGSVVADSLITAIYAQR